MKNEELKSEQEENVSGGYVVEQKGPITKLVDAWGGKRESKIGHSKFRYLVTKDNDGRVLGRYETKAEAMEMANKLNVSVKEISEEDNKELRETRDSSYF